MDLFYYILTFAFVTVNVIIVLFVYFRDPKNRINYSFAVIILLITLWIIVNFLADNSKTYFAALVWAKLTFVTTSFFAWLLLYFVLIFPEKGKLLSPIKKVLLFFPSLIICLLMLTDLIVKGVEIQAWGVNVVFGDANLIFAIYFLGYIIAAFTILTRKSLQAKGLVKTQILYILLGLFLTTVLATVTNLVIPFAFDYFYPSKYGHYFTIFFIALTAYAIIKHRLMNIEIVIRKTVIYSILTALFTGIFLSFILLGEFFFRGIIGYSSVWVAIIAAFVVSIIFQPLRDKIQGAIDRVFFKGKYDYRNTLKNLSQTSASIIDLNQLLNLVVENIIEVFKSDKVSVFLLEKDKDCFTLKKTVGK